MDRGDFELQNSNSFSDATSAESVRTDAVMRSKAVLIEFMQQNPQITLKHNGKMLEYAGEGLDHAESNNNIYKASETILEQAIDRMHLNSTQELKNALNTGALENNIQMALDGLGDRISARQGVSQGQSLR